MKKILAVVVFLVVAGVAANFLMKGGLPFLQSMSEEEKARLREFWALQRRAMDLVKLEGDCLEAVEVFGEALALDPDHEDSLYYHANCLATLGQYDEALAELARLRRVNPMSHRGHAQWGVLRAMTADSGVQLSELRDGEKSFLECGRDGLGKPRIELDGLGLHLARLGVLERHIEERALDRRESTVLLLHRTLDAQLERRPVLFERLCRTAIDVAAELVEQQDERQAAARLIGPVFELALRRLLDVVRKILLDLVIESRVFAEPDIHAAIDLRCAQFVFLEPKREDRVDAPLILVGDGHTLALGKKFH